MSILNSNYEISVWEDRLEDGIFKEVRLGVIGSDQLTTQSKVFEPNLSRKTNGEKKLSFKLYKRYIDNITGEQVENPFYNWLINERKVKLYYKNTWYDFIIKNIVENSSTYLYTYQLEDANIQELSKNGFGVTFDAEAMNNLGTAKKLAEDTLKDTDWSVESEVFIEKVEDRLVYVKSPGISTTVTHIIDQTSNAGGLGFESESLSPETTCLAFYSSCKNRPHRFQFIKLNNYARASVKVDEKSNILESNCQYFIEVNKPEEGYVPNSDFDMYLPTGWSIDEQNNVSETNLLDTTISWWYKAKRYGFSQETIYVPLLKKYCNVYENMAGVRYYGYVDSNYNSPVLIQDMITNGDFSGIKGWTGTYIGNESNAKTKYAAEVESVYGKFISSQFETAEEAIRTGSYNQNQVASYNPYLRIKFGSYNEDNLSSILNSCIYDNRHLIKSFTPGEQWILECDIYDSSGDQYLISDLYNDYSFELCDVKYNTSKGNYEIKKSYGSATHEEGKNYLVFTINKQADDEEEWNETNFLKKNIRLVIQPCGSEVNSEIYIKNIKLYKKVENGVTILQPGTLTNSVIENIVCLALENVVKNETKIEDISFTKVNQKDLDLSIWKPVYTSTGGFHGEKRRTISVKESNYFNILQTIAETFECWLDIQVGRDANGGITSKKVKFKNYAGNTNYAAFRYGVNLKDIQRTFESKKIATKLIVKQNSNELANDGFCTIARANSNPTGENYIYDFQYFHAKDLLNSNQYVAEMYYETNPLNEIEPLGKDIDEEDADWNTQNYFARLKNLNEELTSTNNQIVGVNTELIKLNAEKALQEQRLEAAASSLEEVVEDFISLAGTEPDNVAEDKIQKVEVETNITNIMNANKEFFGFSDNENIDNPSDYISLRTVQKGTDKSLTWNFNISTIEQDLHNIQVDGYANQGYVEFTTSGQGRLAFKPKDGYTQNCLYTVSFELYADYNNELPINEFVFSDENFKELKVSIREGNNLYTTTRNKYKVNDPMVGYYDVRVSFIFAPKDSPNEDIEFTIDINKEGEQLGGDYLIKIVEPSISMNKYIPSYVTKTMKVPVKLEITYEQGSNSYDVDIPVTVPAGSTYWNFDYSFSNIDADSSTISKLLSEYVQYQKEYQDATNKLNGTGNAVGLIASYQEKERQLNNLTTNRQTFINQKQALNQAFYRKYSRFIQEGTWISEDYVDDEKYYNDACSVLYNSCYPQVAYTINVLALENLPGYEGFEFKLGDTTYAEDPDFFGTDRRIEVIITEISENLDDNSSRKIIVQNFKNQFQDLFQKITATTQQAEYNTGAYEKAVALAEANAEVKGQFLSDALSGMASKLSVAGQTDVVQDYSGLTLTDSNTKDQMKLTGGAILMSVEDPDTGERKWKTGLTPEGISASLITAGTINSSEINIMNANDPVFRWDAFGLTAYDAEWNGDSITSKSNPYKFVRFDKHGIYGINQEETNPNAVNGSTWKPTSLDEIKEKAQFALTWDGLFINLGNAYYNNYYSYNSNGIPVKGTFPTQKWHASSTKIGKTNNYIYNAWNNDITSSLYGLPYYNTETTDSSKEFVKVFATGGADGEERLVIYDDGTLVAKDVKFTGTVQWVKNASPSQTVYGHIFLTSPPADGTLYKDFQDDDFEQDGEDKGKHRWHRKKGPNDTVYSKTDTAGAQWDGPFLITGRSIEDTETEYKVADYTDKPEELENWSTNFPTEITKGQYVYTRVRDKYNDGSYSSYRYTVSYNGLDGSSAITCYVESSLGIFIHKDLSGDEQITFTARIFEDGQEIDANGNNLKYSWYLDDELQEEEENKTWETTLAVVRGKQIYFTADPINPQ